MWCLGWIPLESNEIHLKNQRFPYEVARGFDISDRFTFQNWICPGWTSVNLVFGTVVVWTRDSSQSLFRWPNCQTRKHNRQPCNFASKNTILQGFFKTRIIPQAAQGIEHLGREKPQKPTTTTNHKQSRIRSHHRSGAFYEQNFKHWDAKMSKLWKILENHPTPNQHFKKDSENLKKDGRWAGCVWSQRCKKLAKKGPLRKKKRVINHWHVVLHHFCLFNTYPAQSLQISPTLFCIFRLKCRNKGGIYQLGAPETSTPGQRFSGSRYWLAVGGDGKRPMQRLHHVLGAAASELPKKKSRMTEFIRGIFYT